MCFSANISFGAGAVLTLAGVACLKKVKQPTQTIFASIPLLFAVQQITEGFVWLAVKNSDHSGMLQVSTLIFLFFAQVLWPIWVPLSMLSVEKNNKRKIFLRVLSFIGVLLGAYHLYCLIVYPIEVSIAGKHIAYELNHPEGFFILESAIYLLVTIFPPFFSSVKKMWSLGMAILFSFLLTAFIFEHWIISVWCFFAAIISVIVWYLMDRINDSEMNLGDR